MIPPFEPDGNLPPGVHWATWDEINARFGTNDRRRQLLRGLKRALRALKRANCPAAYLNGSFVTAKEVPGDYDVTWEMSGLDATKLDPIFAEFDDDRVAQKIKYGGEFFPVIAGDLRVKENFLQFFQLDEHTHQRKGIVAIDLRGMR